MDEVASSGIATLSISAQEPPRTVGGGRVEAVATPARLAPLILMNDPGAKLVVPSMALTTPSGEVTNTASVMLLRTLCR